MTALWARRSVRSNPGGGKKWPERGVVKIRTIGAVLVLLYTLSWRGKGQRDIYINYGNSGGRFYSLASP